MQKGEDSNKDLQELQNVYTTADEQITWSKSPLNLRVRRSQANVLTIHEGLTPYGKTFVTFLDLCVSYVPKKNRAVILLSSEHTDDQVSGEEHSYKPDMILQYNKTKGAVDTADKLAKQYSCQRKTNRWPMAVFSHLIDIADINAYKLWTIKDPQWQAGETDRPRKFLMEPGKSLMKEHVANRYSNRARLSGSIEKCIVMTFPELENVADRQENETPVQSRGRCFVCEHH